MLNRVMVDKLKPMLLIILLLAVKFDIDILVIFTAVCFIAITIKHSNNKKSSTVRLVLTFVILLIIYYLIGMFEILMIKK